MAGEVDHICRRQSPHERRFDCLSADQRNSVRISRSNSGRFSRRGRQILELRMLATIKGWIANRQNGFVSSTRLVFHVRSAMYKHVQTGRGEQQKIADQILL